MKRSELTIIRSCTTHLEQHQPWTIYADYSGGRHYWIVVMPDGSRRPFTARSSAENYVLVRNQSIQKGKMI